MWTKQRFEFFIETLSGIGVGIFSILLLIIFILCLPYMFGRDIIYLTKKKAKVSIKND